MLGPSRCLKHRGGPPDIAVPAQPNCGVFDGDRASRHPQCEALELVAGVPCLAAADVQDGVGEIDLIPAQVYELD